LAGIDDMLSHFGDKNMPYGFKKQINLIIF